MGVCFDCIGIAAIMAHRWLICYMYTCCEYVEYTLSQQIRRLVVMQKAEGKLSLLRSLMKENSALQFLSNIFFLIFRAKISNEG